MVLPASGLDLPFADTTLAGDVRVNVEHLHGSDFLYIEKLKSKMVAEEEDRVQKEKQIWVDPISVKDCWANAQPVLAPAVSPRKPIVASLRPPSLSAKPKFLSYSLSGSATSPPRFGSGMWKNIWKNQSHTSPPSFSSLVHLVQESELRSKSCGEGRARASSDEFDMWMSGGRHQEEDKRRSSFCKPEAKTTASKGSSKEDEEFKCGTLCLFLPGFGKAKAVRPKKDGAAEMEHAVSRTVSLEKFECGSWTSSAIVNELDVDSSASLYFDLPLELIQSSVNDAHSPVKAAFVFDKDVKGVLKDGRSRTSTRKAQDSPRRVRFSTSSPASPAFCISPRLRKAREDFNAFLEAQAQGA